MTEKVTHQFVNKPERKREVREFLKLTPEEVIERAGEHLRVVEDLDALHKEFAQDIRDEIVESNKRGLITSFIVPVGPTGQYPYLLEFIKEENLDLSHTYLFFMDEYCLKNGMAVSKEHPLSFKRIAYDEFLDHIPEDCGLPKENVVFPDQDTITELTSKIEEVGGIDACFGGIGIHGHLAFNEPAMNVKNSGPRRVTLNDFTVTINSIRSQVGGNLENFPRQAYTVGMAQILGARKIRLYCRNGTSYDWANTVLRIALFGEPGVDYPVTYIRDHNNYLITTDQDTLKTPKNLL